MLPSFTVTWRHSAASCCKAVCLVALALIADHHEVQQKSQAPWSDFNLSGNQQKNHIRSFVNRRRNRKHHSEVVGMT